MSEKPQRGPRVWCSDDSGVSLLELLVVLGIVALALSLVGVNMRRPVAAMEPRALAARLAAELRAARADAISRSRETAFAFNAEERWYQVEGFGRVALPSSLGLTLVTARPFVRGRNDARLVFFADGSATGGRIALQAGNRVHAVVVDWLTGAVRVEGPEGS